jgi:protein-serine/threonine kinase
MAQLTLLHDAEPRLQLSPAVPELPDLLPPSPSTAAPPNRFLPARSPLGGTYPYQNPTSGSVMAPASASSPSLVTPISNPSVSGAAGATVPPAMGPPIRPLDLSKMGDEDVFAELERTVDGMMGWLDCVGAGLEELARLHHPEEPAAEGAA